MGAGWVQVGCRLGEGWVERESRWRLGEGGRAGVGLEWVQLRARARVGVDTTCARTAALQVELVSRPRLSLRHCIPAPGCCSAVAEAQSSA